MDQAHINQLIDALISLIDVFKIALGAVIYHYAGKGVALPKAATPVAPVA